MISNNVVVFPKTPKHPIKNPETIVYKDPETGNVTVATPDEFLDKLMIILTGNILGDLNEHLVFDEMDVKRVKKNLALVMESIRSLIVAMSISEGQDHDHPLNQFAHDVFDDEGDRLTLHMERVKIQP